MRTVYSVVGEAMPDLYVAFKDLLTIVTPIAVAWFGVRGSREFTAIRAEVLKAKEEQLAQKDEQVKAVEKHLQHLSSLISKELWDHMQRQKEGLEQVIREVRAELAEKERQLAELRGRAEGGKGTETLRQADSILSDSIVRLGELDEQLAEQDRALTKMREHFVPREMLARFNQNVDSNEQVKPDPALGAVAFAVALMLLIKGSPDK
jgi:hypothetical protein